MDQPVIASQRDLTPDVRAFLAPYSPEVQAIALALRELVFEVAPDAIEQVDVPARLLAYGWAQTYQDTLCVIMPLKAAVNLGLPRGAELTDPAGLLEGTGKRARHVKVREVKRARQPEVRALLQAAADELRQRRQT